MTRRTRERAKGDHITGSKRVCNGQAVLLSAGQILGRRLTARHAANTSLADSDATGYKATEVREITHAAWSEFRQRRYVGAPSGVFRPTAQGFRGLQNCQPSPASRILNSVRTSTAGEVSQGHRPVLPSKEGQRPDDLKPIGRWGLKCGGFAPQD